VSGLSVSISVKESGKNAPLWDIDSDLNGNITRKDFIQHVKGSLISIAKEALREEQADGFDKEPRVRIDNKFDRPIETVKPFGKIEFFSRLDAIDVVRKIYKEIESRSIVDTGQYKNSNYVFVNNRLVATSRSELSTWYMNTKKTGLPPTAIVRFVNVTPYAARIEYAGLSKSSRGKSAGKTIGKARSRFSKAAGKRVKKPNGTYVLAFRAARAKYKSAAGFMKFVFIPNGYAGITISGSGRFRTTYSPSNKRYSGPYVYPTIVLDFSSKGVLQ